MGHDPVREVAARLAAAGVPSPDVDARLLVEHACEVAGAPVGCGGAVLDALVARRVAREPLQQILGRTWFRTLELRCAPGVFVPRPETEVVAGVAIDAARASTSRPRRVVDVGTGSGTIACALAVEVRDVEVLATERDPAAVELARTNAARTLAGEADASQPPPRTSRLTVLAGDLLDPVPSSWRGHLDVLVSNPPYLPAADRGSWDAEVADHDPDAALVGGPDGHEVVDRLLELAPAWLRPGGTVVVEIDDRRGADALAAADAAGLVDARLVRDLTGRDRAVVATAAAASGSRPGSG
ncbi:peptide chain release factor N(5)-glutamine methyltransferase [Nitriliruptoraceae bacterium ZYF776]|nr:peptide chain release factor N(5)-glutamine methyltransferase [Profundirhabdus halotolerans]